MAASKRFRIPTLDEMEQGGVEKVPEPLFKRRKELSIPDEEPPATTVRNVTSSRDSSAAPNIVNRNIAVKPTPSVNRIQNPPQANGVPAISKGKESSGVKDKLNQNTSERTKETTDSNISKDASNSTDTGSAPTNGVDDEVAKGTSATVSKPGSSNSLIVNTRQRGNPILKSVRNIPWEYGNIVPDYVMGQSNCALFLSLRYHQLHPNYIHERLKLLGRSYDLRVMLVQVDVKEPHHLLKDLAKICLLADCTLIIAFTPEEAGRYLETYKIFENKPPEAIMEKTEENFMAKFTDCLTRVKSVNKTDCTTLISHFGSLANIMEASEEDLSLCPGFGPQKAKRLHDIFHEPFLRSGPKATSDSSSTAIS